MTQHNRAFRPRDQGRELKLYLVAIKFLKNWNLSL